MKTYTVRKAHTNAETATDKGNALSVWITYVAASVEVQRLFDTYGAETYITTETN